MGVIWVREKPGGKSGGQGENGFSVYRNAWTVKCDSPTMTRAAVLACGLLPVYGSPNAENLLAVCVKTDAKRRQDSPYFWDAEAEWQESPLSGRNPSDEQRQPDLRIPKWSSRFIPFPVARFVDYQGQLLCDKAGTPFDPAPDMPIYCEEITIFRYEAAANRAFARGYLGATNTDAWLGAGVGEALVDDIATEMEYIQGNYWWPHTYKILINPRVSITLPKGGTAVVGGFDPDLRLNAGPLAVVTDPTTGKKSVKAVTHGGTYDGRPALLDTDGTQIPIDSTTGQATKDPTFLAFHTKRTALFANLALSPPPGWS